MYIIRTIKYDSNRTALKLEQEGTKITFASNMYVLLFK